MQAFVQAYVQRLLDQGVPGASRLDPDGNGIACDELQSAGGGQSLSAGSASPRPSVAGGGQAATIGSASPQPSVDGGRQVLGGNGNLFEAREATSSARSAHARRRLPTRVSYKAGRALLPALGL